MQSIVLGATGIVGGYILEQMLLAGETPFALSRSPPLQEVRDVKWFHGDLADPSTLVLPEVSTIYCTAHASLLAAALPRLIGPHLRRVVLLTSSSVVTKLDSDIVAEREGLQQLAAGEEAVIAFCKRRAIAWTILRPTLIYDEGRDVNISRLAHLIAKFGVLPLAGRGAGLRQPVHAKDLAIGALQAAASAAAANKIYALPGADTISYYEMVGRIFDGLGKPRFIVKVPPALWRLAFSMLQSRLPNTNVAMGNRMSKDMIFDASPAQRDFGWNPRGFRPRFDRM